MYIYRVVRLAQVVAKNNKKIWKYALSKAEPDRRLAVRLLGAFRAEGPVLEPPAAIHELLGGA
jgi:hypothetical protein